jgi:energy-coupling factor transporter ATP-binding protein EcfA2
LLEKQGQVQWAKLYGTAGQDQQGIDAYARLADPMVGGVAGAQMPARARPYAALQSRRIEPLYPSGITGAVSAFLEGDWPNDTGTFYYATSADLTESRLDAALRDSADRLHNAGVQFVPWGVLEVSELLRPLPRLVDDFFGRAWAEHFCGPEALAALAPRLTFGEVSTLRIRLASLYSAVFNSQTAIRKPSNTFDVDTLAAPVAADNHFAIVDVSPQPLAAIGDSSFAGGISTGFGTRRSPDQDGFPSKRNVSQDIWDAPTSGSNYISEGGDERFVNSSRLGRRRRCFRSVRDLVATARTATPRDDVFREPADAWLSRGDRCLLVGDPGSGKSSLLRFIALDLLDETPQSALLQQKHGGRLPVWLPFGFLCRHLGEAQGNSLVSAIRTWLRSRSADDLIPLAERALEDDRLMLLIDGLDEWTSRDAANVALDAVETFLGRTEAAALLTSRPYAVNRLVSALTWERASICDLTDAQRRQIASQYLAPPEQVHRLANSHSVFESRPGTSIGAPSEPATGILHQPNPFVDPFIDQVSAEPALATLSRVPLFLALLATTWQGEPLPARRYDLFASIIDLLIWRHPQMRRRASSVGDLPVTDRDFLLAIEAVAYRLRAEGNLGPVPTSHVRQHLRDAFGDEEIGGYPLGEARQIAEAAMHLAEGEFGLLVDQGADQVGFIHRVVLDQLAGQHLSKLAGHEQIQVFSQRIGDPSWLDVLLASLAAQSNPPAVAALIDTILDDDSDRSRGWPWEPHRQEIAWEFVAAALAAGVEVSPRKFHDYLGQLVERVDSYVSLEHRAALLTSLVRVYSHTNHGRRLSTSFKRWLNATRPYPAPALYQLRDLAIDDLRASGLLLRGMRSDHEATSINAAAAYAHRFGNDHHPDLVRSDSGQTEVDAVLSKTMLDLVVTALGQGPTSDFQSAALLAMGYGWLGSEITQEHVRWARTQPIAKVRTVALYLTSKSMPDAPLRSFLDQTEIEWLLSQVRHETHVLGDFVNGMMHDLLEHVVSEAEPVEQYEIATFVLATLSDNGRNGGHRDICWRLACTALANDQRLRDWVISELRDNDDRPLILYNLALIPRDWLENADMQAALASRPADDEGWTLQFDPNLSPHLPAEHVRTHLLKALDSYRPWGIARRLLRDFGEDDRVRAELASRVQDDRVGPTFSPIVLDLLGIEDGFARLYSMLVSANENGSEIEKESHVLLAQAVAQAWEHIRDLPVGNVEAEQAIRVMEMYSEEEVCAACVAAPTEVFSWHIPDVIRTWPDRVVDYARRALASNRHITEGIDDVIHSTVLRAYAGQAPDSSNALLEQALDMLTFLEPELREVLVHELCSTGTDSDRLIDLLTNFKTDPDDGVRRTAIVGITQAVSIDADYTDGSTTSDGESQRDIWLQYVRRQLCAYGPTLDADRQNAWIAMLLMRDFALLDGVIETIGSSTAPGVSLTDIFGSPDNLLINLLVLNWDGLERHFGDQLLVRLSGSRDGGSASLKVISAVRSLAIAAEKHSRVSRLVASFEAARATDAEELSSILKLTATQDPNDQKLLRELEGLRSSPEVIDLAARQGVSGIDLVQMLLQVEVKGTGGPRRRRSADQWAVDRLLDSSWHHLEDEQLRDILAANRTQDGWDGDRPWSLPFGVLERAVWTMLYPQSDDAQRWLNGLAQWFIGGETSEGPLSWLEFCAVVFGAAPAADLPVLVARVFNPDRMQYVRDDSWEMTLPLAYRLRWDQRAVDSLRASLAGGPVAHTSPFLAGASQTRRQTDSGTIEVVSEDRTAQAAARTRMIWAAMISLSSTGHLRPDDRDAALDALRRSDTRSIVHDPHLDRSGPLWAACVPLLRPLSR